MIIKRNFLQNNSNGVFRIDFVTTVALELNGNVLYLIIRKAMSKQQAYFPLGEIVLAKQK